MAIETVMWSAWGLLAVITAAFYAYRSKLTSNEENQVYLDDSFNQFKAEQANIVDKVNKLQPVMRTFLWLFVASTVFVAGYYIWDIVSQFK
jgi:hypothetical protein